MRKPVQRVSSFFLVLVLISLNCIPATAWGAPGHHIVATIAERHLTPKAKQAIAEILGTDVSLASVSTYADDIRRAQPETYNFHFVDIPKDANDYVPSRDCQQTGRGDCVIAALERFQQDLANPKKSKEEKQFALKFIVHLIGDMHQPLHSSDNNDRGGNDVKVEWFGKATNLHSVWDSMIIQQTGLGESEYASLLEKGLTAQQIEEMQQGTIVQWALEAHRLARDYTYVVPSDRKLDQAYYDRNRPIVEQQLLKGGLRLAKVLNNLFESMPLGVVPQDLKTKSNSITDPTPRPSPSENGNPSVKVWVNKSSRVYHCPGSRYYGQTKNGEYMTQKQAQDAGNHAAHGKVCQ
jgi:hypothetical protein